MRLGAGERDRRRGGRAAAVVAPIIMLALAWGPAAEAAPLPTDAQGSGTGAPTPSGAASSIEFYGDALVAAAKPEARTPVASRKKARAKARKRARAKAAAKKKAAAVATAAVAAAARSKKAPTPKAVPPTTAPPTTAPPTTAPPTTVPPTTVPPTTVPPTTVPPTTAPPTTVPPTTAPPTTAPPTTVPPAAAQRDARLWPFASSSPWNTPIGSNAAFASTSDPRYADLVSPWVAINAATWSMSTYVATTADPVRTVTSHAGTWQYRIPNNATPSGPTDGDRHLLVLDPSGQYVDECWLASKQSDGNWWCEYHVRNDLRGAGVLENGVRAYGGSALGGLLRTWEIQQGSIGHALALAMPRAYMKHGPVWPANSEDGGATYGGNLPMGSLVAIPKTVNLNSLGLSPGGLAVAKALQNYGAYLVDASENFTLYAEPSAEGILTGARADLEEIRAQLRIVTNNSASTPGGGGTPVAPTAPGFGS